MFFFGVWTPPQKKKTCVKAGAGTCVYFQIPGVVKLDPELQQQGGKRDLKRSPIN